MVVDPFYEFYIETQDAQSSNLDSYPGYSYFLGLGQRMLLALQILAPSLAKLQCPNLSNIYDFNSNNSIQQCDAQKYENLYQQFRNLEQAINNNPAQIISLSQFLITLLPGQEENISRLFLEDEQKAEIDLQSEINQDMKFVENEFQWFQTSTNGLNGREQIILDLVQEENYLKFEQQDSNLRLQIMKQLNLEIAPWLVYILFPTSRNGNSDQERPAFLPYSKIVQRKTYRS